MAQGDIVERASLGSADGAISIPATAGGEVAAALVASVNPTTGAAVTPLSAVTEDAPAAANPAGPVMMAVANTTLANEVPDADHVALRSTRKGELFVKQSDPTPAGELHIGEVSSPADLITITPTVLNADAYDAGDVVFDSTVITNAMRVIGGRAMLQSIVVADKGDQKAQLRLVFFDSNVSLGTADAAPSVSDADALKCLGTVEVLAADYIDLGGVSVATVKGIALLLEADAASRDLYVAAFTSGTPTYATGDLQLRFGLLHA